MTTNTTIFTRRETPVGRSGIALTIGIVSALAGIFAIWLLDPLVIVGPGEVGVVTDWGHVEDRILQPGLYILMPWSETLHTLNKRVQIYRAERDEAGSADLQNVFTSDYRIDPVYATWIFSNIARDSDIVDPAIHNAVSAAAAS